MQPDDPVSMNLLIVPYPYKVHALSFERASPAERVKERGWGWFDLKQSWLDSVSAEDMADWVYHLIRSAQRDCETVHGVIFPELAMKREHFDEIVRQLEAKTEVELMISGVSDDGNGRSGNFVATRLMKSNAQRLTPGQGVTRLREKHHRWRMDNGQITGYALSSALPATAAWWERLDILSRSLDVFVFRRDSALTTLICEDLARVDPCQELVRSIGPNLVVALLMDSAQIKERWPARYATVLAEDPGSSVLTVTSRALIDRVNAEGEWGSSNAIALWRDDSGHLRSIQAPPTADAVLLTLAGDRRKEKTLDGRESPRSVVSWRYHGQQPVVSRAEDGLRAKMWMKG
jgi:hypothetical protein